LWGAIVANSLDLFFFLSYFVLSLVVSVSDVIDAECCCDGGDDCDY